MIKIIFKMLFTVYKKCNYKHKKLIRNFIKKFDGGEMYSPWLRKILKEYHNIIIGEGSYGGCFRLENINANTTIGKYCSIASNVYIYNRNHPCRYVSTHPIFFNENYGDIPEENIIQYKQKVIGNDVWIGQNAIILASVMQIGDGAIIGAGAVVTKDVPDYAIVAGVPAKIVGYRFDDNTMDTIKKIKWWDWDLKKIQLNIKNFSNTSSFIEIINEE